MNCKYECVLLLVFLISGIIHQWFYNSVPLLCQGALKVSGLYSFPDIFAVDYEVPVQLIVPHKKDVTTGRGYKEDKKKPANSEGVNRFLKRQPDGQPCGYIESIRTAS